MGESAQLVVIKNAGHAVHLEKPKEFAEHLKLFLIGSCSTPSSPILKEQIHKSNVDWLFDFVLIKQYYRFNTQKAREWGEGEYLLFN